jgi:autotransporter-associated beta strand protein
VLFLTRAVVGQSMLAAVASGVSQRARRHGGAILRKAAALYGCLLAIASLVFLLAPAAPAHAQPLTIPLQYNLSPGSSANWSLGINVGINNGGTPQPYLFDTGSTLFNATYNPSTWAGFGQGAPAATVANGSGVAYSYGSPPNFLGNVVQATTLNFYSPTATTATSTPVVTLSASPGFQISAVYSTLDGSVKFPEYYQTSSAPPFPVTLGPYYGVFGAGNFAGTVNGGSPSPGNPNVGGVLGQAVIPGVQHQGYVVSANGQPNPATYNSGGQPIGPYVNSPSGNSIVLSGGQIQQVNPNCVACVTVGLTPALIGQFGPVNSVVPVASGTTFPNPYSTGTPNPGSTEEGVRFRSTLSTGKSQTGASLLDTGTTLPGFWIGDFNPPAGTTLSMTGVTQSDGAIAGVQTITATVTTGTPGYTGTYEVVGNGGTGNILGIPFFMQNSVMFDLTGQAIGYTPFYVTAADIGTTQAAPFGSLTVGSTNVPLGIAGVISGAGGVTVNSGGMLQLSATNTYTGQTTIAGGGQLNISGPGSIASSSGVVNNGVFDISGAWPASSLSGGVSIQSLSGAGQVNLGGQNLAIKNGGSVSGTIADGGFYGGAGGSLTIAGGSMTLSGSNTFTGGTTVSGGTLTLAALGTMTSAVTVQSGGSFVNQGVLRNNLTNGGSTANNSGIVGNIVNTGAFANNGIVIGSLANTGTLSGTGHVTGDTGNAGTISPGNSIGTITIGGNYGHLAGGLHQAEVNSSGQTDLINVGGRAALLGGTVSVAALPGGTYAPRTTYTILTAAGGVTGTYASVVDPYPFLLPSLSYDANNVHLTLQIGGFAAAAQTRTQAAVGRVLDANVNTASGDFASVLGAMATNTLSPAQAQATLTALSGQNYSSFSSTMVQGAQLFMNNFANQTGGGGSPASNRVALAEACDVACDPTGQPLWGAWGGVLGGLGTIGANTGTGAVTYNVGGFATGLDRRVAPGVRVGLTTGYTTGTQWTSGFSGNGTTDTFLAGLYGNYREGKVYADAVAGYAYSYNQMWRQIFIPGLQQRLAQGRTGSNQFYGQIEGGYRFDIGGTAEPFITPFARLQGYTGTQNAFTETGAQSLNLSVAGQTTNSLRSVIGVQLGAAFDLGWREKLALQFRLGWSHEYANTARPVTATLGGAPLSPFTIYGIAPQRDGAVVGLSANTAIADGTSMYLRYEGNISGSDSAHALTAGVRMTW